ncbi:MAG: hypothetical protein AAB493_01640 [Patescibacteria group bacterium]
MENEIKKEKKISPILSIIVVVILIIGGWIYTLQLKSQEEKISWHPAIKTASNETSLKGSVELPVRWGDIGVKMVKAGVIDKDKFEALYSGQGGLSESEKKLLYNTDNGNLAITEENSGVMLNLLWSFGLGNKNSILENGPMMDKQYGGAGNFASTGGWTLAQGDAMTHYSMHSFITLTLEQQALVEKISKEIFRPCCNNSTYFPDCNHGIAMLGLLELMASQGVSENEMYRVALQVNTLWFPNQYESIKTFFVSQNIDWNTVDPKIILGTEYSSASGYQKVLSQIQPQQQKGGTSCAN